MASRVQGGAAARPWWHNPDLDMPVEDIATFYREHTQKLGKLHCNNQIFHICIYPIISNLLLKNSQDIQP